MGEPRPVKLDSLLEKSGGTTSPSLIRAPLVATHGTLLPFHDLRVPALETNGPFALLTIDGSVDARLQKAAWSPLKELVLPSARLILDDCDPTETRLAVEGWLSQADSWCTRCQLTLKRAWAVGKDEYELPMHSFRGVLRAGSTGGRQLDILQRP